MSKIKEYSVKSVLDFSDQKLKESTAFLAKELFNLRFQKTYGELQNHSIFKVVKKI
jgi:ribosomal protein L29